MVSNCVLRPGTKNMREHDGLFEVVFWGVRVATANTMVGWKVQASVLKTTTNQNMALNRKIDIAVWVFSGRRGPRNGSKLSCSSFGDHV